jgi:hypothetical protein
VTALASAVLLLTVLAHYAKIADSAGFADRAVSVVRAGPVRSLIANDISRRLVAAGANSDNVQPPVDEAVQQALLNGPVTAEVRAATASLQSQLLSGRSSDLTLTLPDLGPAIASSLERRSPELAAEVQSIGTITVVDVRISPSASQAVNDLAYLGRDATLLIVLTVALAALALLLSPDRRRTVIGLGAGACGTGLLAVAAYLGGREAVLGEFSSQNAETAAGVVWSVFLGGMEALGFVIAGLGAAVATAAALLGAGRATHADDHGWSPV